jgi:hypothetical protein
LPKQFEGKTQNAITVFEKIIASYGQDAMRPEVFIKVFPKFASGFQTAIKEKHHLDRRVSVENSSP